MRTFVQGFTMALAANNIQPQERRKQDQIVQEMVAQNAPHLTPEVVRQVSAIICHLHSSLTWATLKQRFGLSSDETVNALTWALKSLIKDLKKTKGGLL